MRAPKVCLTKGKGRCAFGTHCTCEFYSRWTVEWPKVDQSIPAQYSRRRQAAFRSARLLCGRRDPWSRSLA